MNLSGVPDLLISSRNARDLAATNQALTVAAKEMSSGLRENLVEASGGDPGKLYILEQDIETNEVLRSVLSLAASRATVTQSALASVGDAVGEIGISLAAAAERDDFGAAVRIANGARSAFEAVVSSMNVRFGDRMLFAGADTEGPALASADAMLSDITARVAGLTDAASVEAAIDDYFFVDPAGFEAVGYLGSTADASEVEVRDGVFVSFAKRADNNVIRETLASLAAAVVGSDDGGASLSQRERLTLLSAASLKGVAARDGITALEAEVGFAEAQIDKAAVNAEAERTVLEIARNKIVARDPFEAATEFTALESQVQAIFAVTARLSSLSLTGFLR